MGGKEERKGGGKEQTGRKMRHGEQRDGWEGSGRTQGGRKDGTW